MISDTHVRRRVASRLYKSLFSQVAGKKEALTTRVQAASHGSDDSGNKPSIEDSVAPGV